MDTFDTWESGDDSDESSYDDFPMSLEYDEGEWDFVEAL